MAVNKWNVNITMATTAIYRKGCLGVEVGGLLPGSSDGHSPDVCIDRGDDAQTEKLILFTAVVSWISVYLSTVYCLVFSSIVYYSPVWG